MGKQTRHRQKINIPSKNSVVVILFVTKTDKQSEQECECVGMMMIIMIMTLIIARVVPLSVRILARGPDNFITFIAASVQ